MARYALNEESLAEFDGRVAAMNDGTNYVWRYSSAFSPYRQVEQYEGKQTLQDIAFRYGWSVKNVKELIEERNNRQGELL